LFNFQGTGRLATVFIFYHKPLQLSRTFFKFFKLCFLFLSAPFATVFGLYHIPMRLSTTFLHPLGAFFGCCRLVRDSLVILPPQKSFVKHFFHYFSTFSVLLLNTQRGADSPQLPLVIFTVDSV